MAIAVPATRQTVAAAYTAIGSWISLHTGDPLTTGANKASGGSPAYARKQTTWTAGSGGVMNGSQVTFDVPANTYTYAGIWTASSAGTFVDKVLITSTTLGAQGQILVTPTFTES